jgi:phage/plasmid-associated DNA primase
MKVVLVGNKPMSMNDTVDSLRRRFNPTTLRTYARPEGDPVIEQLANKIIDHDGGAGLLNLLIKYWAKLQSEGFPELPKGAPGLEILGDSARQNSPTRSHFEAELEVFPGWVSEGAVYAAYKAWCDVNGIMRPLNSMIYKSELREILEGLHPGVVAYRERPYVNEKKQNYGYMGLRFAASVENPNFESPNSDEYTERQLKAKYTKSYATQNKKHDVIANWEGY